MTRASDARTDVGDGRPAWLEEAPAELKPILELGYEKFGDRPTAIAEWIEGLHEYREFWSLVETSGLGLEERYERDEALQAQIKEARAHPERRVPRPARRTA